MEILTPEFGLLAWTFIGFCNLLLVAYALIRLLKNKATSSTGKLFWLVPILFLPFIGSVIFLKSFDTKSSGSKATAN